MARITTWDEGDLMPPPKVKHPLSAAAIEVLRRWIAEGAEYAGHWAFEKPVASGVGDAGGGDGGGHLVDRLVRERLEEQGLDLSPAAEPRVLARRLWLDLIGLPPSPEELERFEERVTGSGLAEAMEVTGAELMETPHYGERWARIWMDAARYADTNGYEKDLPREQWAWRDWVIRAFQEDRPYDQFVVEQIAGDLLPDAGLDQVVATGFLRNGMINEEGAIVPEQFRMEAMFDRLDCIGKATLGLTLQCAQCHTHKFDPITHDE
jgi:hypothetical protein